VDFSSFYTADVLRESGKNTYEELINTQVKAALKEAGVIGADVSSSVFYDASSGEIEVQYVQVAVSDEYDTQSVKEMIFDTLGVKARVIHIGQ